MSTNGRIVRKVFGDQYSKELNIPCFIDNYNHNMGGVDLANQFRESYETHRATLRNWWPLFYWLIDVACINAYRLYLLHIVDIQPLTHLQFRIELYCKLFEYSSKAKLHSLQIGLGGKRVFNSDLLHIHYYEKRSKGVCVWCSYRLKCQKVLGKTGSSKISRVKGGCVFCNVNLCKEGNCWADFHSNNADY